MGIKYAVFDENGFAVAFYDSDINNNIPQNAVQITHEQWSDFLINAGRRYWDGKGVRVFDSDTMKIVNKMVISKTPKEILNEKKMAILEDLSRNTKNYITQFYPDLKQQSDLIDKENAEKYLLSQNIININELKKIIFDEIGENYPNYDVALNNISNKYDLSDETTKYWVEQMLKALFRQHFVFLVKQEYYKFLDMIDKATSVDEIPQVSFNTQFVVF